jgi:D-alanine-D-alanine ligase-like ATP-grasp enzyme
MAEKAFFEGKGRYAFTTFEDEWLSRGDAVYRYEKFEDQVLKKLIHRAFAITRMFDYGKFDIRLDPSGQFYFIDTNCNPAFGPKELDVALSNILDIYGIPFHELLKSLLLHIVRDASGTEPFTLPKVVDAEVDSL